MRRHGHIVSPSKEGVRRRLFQSPAKSRTFLPTALQTSRSVSKEGLIAFACFALMILVAVHLYLFQAVVRNQNETKSVEQKSAFQPPQLAKSPPVIFQTRVLEPLRPIDLEQYTIRINTWKRPEQLVISVDHHASCPGVAQIQIIWCDPDEEPPVELLNYTNVVIEKHDVNTLNERFHILTPDTPTLGILSIDDDVLRPCEAIDDGFFKWTRSPHRMVGFDGRLHVEHTDGTWQYGYMSTTEKANKYSMSLTRYCFIHRDYMDMYMNDLPSTILDTVANNFNCEDVAMSLMISSMTKGKPSLLADFWAIKSMVKLYVEKKISAGHDHKSLRDDCVNNFAQILGLKEEGTNRLRPATYMHHKESLYSGGDVPETVSQHPKTARERDLDVMLKSWRDQGKEKAIQEIRRLMSRTGFRAFKQGLMEKSDPWKRRFGK